MNNKRLPICILAAAMAASALLPGCSKAPAEEASIFTEIEAATPAPVATLAPAPTPTPVTLISESNTPRPTRPPTPTPEPTPEPTPAPTPAPAAAPEPQASSSAGRRYNDTPYKDSYTPVTISAATGSASNFTSALIGGGSVSKSVFSQAKITLVNYWSTT